MASEARWKLVEVRLVGSERDPWKGGSKEVFRVKEGYRLSAVVEGVLVEHGESGVRVRVWSCNVRATVEQSEAAQPAVRP